MKKQRRSVLVQMWRDFCCRLLLAERADKKLLREDPELWSRLHSVDDPSLI